MMKKNILQLVIALALVSCQENENKTEKEQAFPPETTVSVNDYSGDYVTDEYSKRGEGYDWLVVSTKKLTDSTMHFHLQARMDKKKATCSFDGDGIRVSEGVYKAKDGDYSVLFTFKDNDLTISGEGTSNDETILHWYCSGGASLSDYKFTKINEALDETQLKEK